MQRTSLNAAIKELHSHGSMTSRKGNFTVGDFCVKVNIIGVEESEARTRAGSLFTRLRVEDEGQGVLVVRGSDRNRKNLDLVTRRTPARIRVKVPVRPHDEYIEKYGVDMWAHEDLSVIEVIK
jgi:hypothetical protein